jgi:AcrR family transcriptional regulator
MRGTPGRPLSAELSEQLLTVAVDILADEGWGRLNSDRVAARAHAGKAGIYRRWSTMSALARAALGRLTVVPRPHDQGSMRADLLALVAPWLAPLGREERAVASVVGAARHDPDLRAGLDAVLTAPLAVAVAEIGARAVHRGEALPERIALLGSVIEAFWCQRLTGTHDGAMTAEQLARVVDDVLLPLVTSSGATASASAAPPAGLAAAAAVF